MIGISASQFDTNALSFLNIASITNPTERLAINYLVFNLKLNNLWTKFHALYPIIGGTATSHSFNLINPLNTDAAFRLVFSGTWTHSSNGMLPNGTSAFANTFLIPSTTMTLNSSAIGIYSRTITITNNGVDIGVISLDSVNDNRLVMQVAGTVSSMSTRVHNLGSGGANSTAITNTQGLFVASRNSSTSYTNYRNSTNLGSATINSFERPTRVIYIGAQNSNGVAQVFSTRQLAFAFISTGLTAEEVSTLYTIVQQYQTILGRAV